MSQRRLTNDPTGGAPERLDHRFPAVVVALVHRIVRGVRYTIACQEHLHERYVEGLGTSGLDARSLLAGRSQEERDLEALFNAAAISNANRRDRSATTDHRPPAAVRSRTDPR